jgi:hypothetical protein
MMDDKLFMRKILTGLDLQFPETLAFSYCNDSKYDINRPQLKVVLLGAKEGVENLIFEEIQRFLELPFMMKYEKVS